MNTQPAPAHFEAHHTSRTPPPGQIFPTAPRPTPLINGLDSRAAADLDGPEANGRMLPCEDLDAPDADGWSLLHKVHSDQIAAVSITQHNPLRPALGNGGYFDGVCLTAAMPGR